MKHSKINAAKLKFKYLKLFDKKSVHENGPIKIVEKNFIKEIIEEKNPSFNKDANILK